MQDKVPIGVRHHRTVLRYHPAYETYLCRLGLYQVATMTRINLDPAGLIHGLVERWRPETHTFHLPVGEMTVTLQDVSCLWGLPIHGIPVGGVSDGGSAHLVQPLLGMTPDVALKKRKSGEEMVPSGYHLKLKAIRDEFAEPLGEGYTDEELRRYILFYLIVLTNFI